MSTHSLLQRGGGSHTVCADCISLVVLLLIHCTPKSQVNVSIFWSRLEHLDVDQYCPANLRNSKRYDPLRLCLAPAGGFGLQPRIC